MEVRCGYDHAHARGVHGCAYDWAKSVNGQVVLTEFSEALVSEECYVEFLWQRVP